MKNSTKFKTLMWMMVMILIIAACLKDTGTDKPTLANILPFKDALEIGFSAELLDNGNGSDNSLNFFGFSSTIEEDSILSKVCFLVDFPIILIDIENQTQTFEDYDALSSAYDQAQYQGFIYPINLIEKFGDKLRRTINNDNDLGNAIADCVMNTQ